MAFHLTFYYKFDRVNHILHAQNEPQMFTKCIEINVT